MNDETADVDAFLDPRLEVLIADANEAGFGTQAVLDGLGRAIRRQRRAYEADPDPADEPDPGEAMRK